MRLGDLALEPVADVMWLRYVDQRHSDRPSDGFVDFVGEGCAIFAFAYAVDFRHWLCEQCFVGRWQH
jgi:hypothetical protein